MRSLTSAAVCPVPCAHSARPPGCTPRRRSLPALSQFDFRASTFSRVSKVSRSVDDARSLARISVHFGSAGVSPARQLYSATHLAHADAAAPQAGPSRRAKLCKIKVATPGDFGTLTALFDWLASRDRRCHWKGKRPEDACVRVSMGGHNNIKMNPVFRGMVRRHR